MSRHPVGRLALVATLGFQASACDTEKAAEPTYVRPVLTVVAEAVDTVPFGPFTGTVEPRYLSQLGFQIGGRMVARDVTVGDLVRKGQRLAALDPVVPRYALSRAAADVADARAQADNTASAESRTRRLLDGGTVSQAQSDGTVASRDTARARLRQAEANLRRAQDQLDYTELKADFDGVVTERRAEVGQDVTAGQTVVTLARPEVREAVVDIPEDLVGAMPVDARFAVRLQSVSSVLVVGIVREIAPFANQSTRARRVRLTLQDPPAAFRLGATVTVGFSRSVPSVIRLPMAAVLDADGRTVVWVVAASGTAVSRRLVTVSSRRDDVATVEGIAAGERVVVAGVRSLTEGQTVRLADEAP